MRFLFSILFAGLALCASANNVTVSNTGLSGQNTTADFTLINFDVAWENSWRTSTNESNYDGAWIFVKYRKNGTTDWRHCTINATGHTAAAGSVFSVPSDGKGAFIYRNADGIGNVSFTGNSLRWNYGADGLLDNETVEIRVFALESVYITGGQFFLGSGGNEPNAFELGGSTATPYSVTSNDAITTGAAAGNLSATSITAGTIPVAYPKGFNAFWVMKYETSQQQYTDFLNHIDQAKATANSVSKPMITGTHPALVAAQPERAMSAVSVQNSAALADWSGLRPMTELEFEKACRGYNTPVVNNEYVWGNTTIVGLSSVTNAGLTNEAVAAPVTANANFGNNLGVPARVGIFARSTGSTRALSGGTYYGVMNMGDNVNENVITAQTTQGRAVDASVHGDGFLANDGRSNVTAWTLNTAWGLRGTTYNGAAAAARTSDRSNTTFYSAYGFDYVDPAHGVRLVRTAP